MKKQLDSAEMREWARAGAKRRITELKQELDRIYVIFPELRGREPRQPTPSVARLVKRRRRMSVAGRARLRASLKKRWAEAKKAGKKRLG